MTTITVPRETWVKVVDALKHTKRDLRSYGFTLYHWHKLVSDALAAANAVPEPTVPDNSQDWKGMDGTTAFHLITRHADGWADVGKMMGEWLAANAVSEQDSPVGKCGVLSKSEPQAQGEAITLQRWGRAENLCLRLLDPMDDGYWTPWHIAQEAIDSLQKKIAFHPQATEPAPKKLIGWRTADYLHETKDRHVAENWEVHNEILPIFEGDTNTKLAAAPEAP